MIDDHLDLAERFFAAIEAGDLDAVGGIYADEAVIWHNHDGVEPRSWSDFWLDAQPEV
ncbi:MAG: hypothetical protein ACRDZ2_00205 [Ilumatobacteraceae bacterium]